MSRRDERSPTRDGKHHLEPSVLVKHVVELYETFDEERTSFDEHVNAKLAEWKVAEPEDAQFFRDSLYGMERFRDLLEASNSVFYSHNRASVLREDKLLYLFNFYLAICRLALGEMSFWRYSKFIYSQDFQKMTLFLRFCFDEGVLRGPMREEWLCSFDHDWVDGLIERLLSFSSDVDNLTQRLERVYMPSQRGSERGRSFMERERGTISTTPEPFSLSTPKTKLVPPPDDEETQAPPPPKEVPEFKEGPTKEEIELERQREENRQRAVRPEPFKLATSELPERQRDKRLNEELRAKEQEEKAEAAKSRGRKPPPPPPQAEVKLNTAAILREDALYKKKQEEEARMIREYEQTLRDEYEFKRRQEELARQEEEERKREVEQLKSDMEAVHEAAIEARKHKQEENQELAAQIKAEIRDLEEKRKAETEAEEEAKRSRKQAVEEEKEGVQKAKEKVVKEKKSIADERAHERAEASKQKAEEKELEHQRKVELVRQIKAIERTQKKHEADIDHSALPGHGLLGEMSLTELKERLEMAKERQAQEEEEQRRRIMQQKQEQAEWLQRKAEGIRRVRSLARTHAREQRKEEKERKREEEEEEEQKKEQGAKVLDERLRKKREAQRQEARRLHKERREVERKQQQQQQTASRVEEKKLDNLKRGAEREVASRQEQALASGRKQEQLRRQEERQREVNVQRHLKTKADFLRAYDEKVQQISRERKEEERQRNERKRSLVTSERERFNTLLSNPSFSNTAREQSTLGIARPERRKEEPETELA